MNGKTLIHTILHVVCTGICLVVLGCAAAGSSIETGQGGPGEADIQRLIDHAIKDAKKTGKTKIDIYLDEDPEIIQEGDYVTVHATATLNDGSLVFSTRRDTGEVTKAQGYRNHDLSVPLKIFAGDDCEVPGLGQAVVGMKKGQVKSVILPPARAYGEKIDRLVMDYDRVKTMPKRIRLKPGEYVQAFNRFAVVGSRVMINPYFPSQVVEVTEHYAVLEQIVEKEASYEDSLGTTVVRPIDDAVEIALTPEIGAAFAVGEKTGIIIECGTGKFTVDFNDPLAGREITLEIDVVSYTKASVLRDEELSWMEDHDTGMQMARESGKPATLVLYSDGCMWCRRLFADSLEDPRIKALKDEFVWIKVNSGENPEFQYLYNQDGFPLIVIVDAKGETVKRIDGFKSAAELRGVLLECLRNAS